MKLSKKGILGQKCVKRFLQGQTWFWVKWIPNTRLCSVSIVRKCVFFLVCEGFFGTFSLISQLLSVVGIMPTLQVRKRCANLAKVKHLVNGTADNHTPTPVRPVVFLSLHDVRFWQRGRWGELVWSPVGLPAEQVTRVLWAWVAPEEPVSAPGTCH